MNRIRNDKNALTTYVSEKEEGIQQLEKIIKRVLEDKARFERELRIRQQQETLKTKSFKALKGQLPWPADGRIISKFGRQWNSKLKTTTENPLKEVPKETIESEPEEQKEKTVMPSTELLDRALDDGASLTESELNQIASLLEDKLDEFGIEATVESVLPGCL